MITKNDIIKRFQLKPGLYWKVRLFDEMGFERRQCKKCGRFFWSLSNREMCSDSSCREYEFIGKKTMNKKYDYFTVWRVIRKFFIKNGHVALERYPVLCRWFPNLYFTIAGIVNFYRMEDSKFVFELPADKIILLQPCLRFNDIPQVGVSGRHWTCHSHVEQASGYDGKKGYWKDTCIELDFDLLTRKFGIKPELIDFIEEAWLGPGAFGYSLEYHVAGLELGNAVFTEFAGTPDNYKQLRTKIIDMGAGLERFCWLSQGVVTSYDAVLGKVIEKLKKRANLEYDKEFFLKYAKLAGRLNLDDVNNIEAVRAGIAKRLGVARDELINKVEPVRAIYAIVDHARTLLFAITDNGIPSNVAGGYNLRVILRRALSFIDKYKFPFDLFWITEQIARYFKPAHPELIKNLDRVERILNIEKKRFKESERRAKRLVEVMIKKGVRFDEDKLIELYDSQGITPEFLIQVASKLNTEIEIPADLYAKVTEKHEKLEKKEKEKINIKSVKKTKLLFYDDENRRKFRARILRIINNIVILDKTLFYPRGGGQEPDHGSIGNNRVYDVKKIDNIVVHFIESKKRLKEGDKVDCKIDWTRRKQLMQHHSAVHIINGVARKTLGEHVWQAGSWKDVDKAHLDITHYQALSEKEIEKMEGLANGIIKKGILISKKVLERNKAEKKYGMRIYQGGVVPSKMLRIVEIKNHDVEACGGLHLSNTKDVEKIIITSTERIQDGVVRINLVAGNAARKYEERQKRLVDEISEILNASKKDLVRKAKLLFKEWKSVQKKLKKKITERALLLSKRLEEKFVKNILIDKIDNMGIEDLKNISKVLSNENRVILLFGLNDKISILGSAGKNTKIDIGKIVKNVCEQLGGKGGGSSHLGQGSGTEVKKLNKVIEGVKKELIG